MIQVTAMTWQQRWQRWWRSRLRPCEPTLLTQRNLYILPARAGAMLALTLLLLLVGSINFQLNLGYLLTFLIAGSAFIGMHLAHANLRGLQLNVQAAGAVFAGQAAQVEIRIHNPTNKQRFAVALHWCLAPTGPRHTHGASTVCVDVAPRASQTASLAWTSTSRGHWELPPVCVHTRFPLGSFRVWHWWQPSTRVWVFPAPETPAPPLPLHAQAHDGPAPAPQAGAPSDETDGLRLYRRGDPLKWVAWKKAARQGAEHAPQWLSRDFTRHSASDLWLDASLCGLQDQEGRRSRLCAWVLQADTLGLSYGLRLGAVQIPPGQGRPHRQRCLEALACD